MFLMAGNISALLFPFSSDETIFFQIICLIIPVSVFLGVYRGVFQGYQNMKYLLLTRVIEQICIITISLVLILLGLSILGAVLGSILGFIIAAMSAYISI
jgi:stage V sporulation protein B